MKQVFIWQGNHSDQRQLHKDNGNYQQF